MNKEVSLLGDGVRRSFLKAERFELVNCVR